MDRPRVGKTRRRADAKGAWPDTPCIPSARFCAAGNRLTTLLREHILGAVALLQAAKSGDGAAIAKASSAWYANANQIADFLHAANPRDRGRAETRAMMKTHLDETLKEAQDRLHGDFTADIRDYEAVHRHILAMADELSNGIMRQFPRRF